MENMIYLHGELEQYDKAIAIGNEALDFAVENKNPSSALYLYRKLSKLYAANNDHKTAFDYSSQYIQLRDSTFSEEKTIAAAELEEQYNTKRKDIENKTLKEKEKANAFTIESQKHINFALFTIALLFMLLGASLFYAYDINKRRSILLEETVKERTKELVSSNAQLIKSNEELQNFAYIASHDLKEPIVTMTAFSTLLNKEVSTLDNQQLKDVSGFIHSNANRLLNLVQDLLEFSNISNQDQMAQFVDLNATLKSVTNIIRGNSKKEFEIVCNQTLPHIKSYESKMFTLFLNLISNGLKYNHSSAPMVKIAYTIDDSYCTFSISDNGIGIAPEHFEKIFMMFKRLNNRSEFEGSGLGLASCKKIVELMQGIIWVDSENRNGTTFYFSIPIELVDKIPSKSVKRLSASII